MTTSTTDHVLELLRQTRVIRDRTDLDLLLFVFRHPNSLLSVEQLAALVGYDQARLKASLQRLIDGGMMDQTTHPGRSVHSFALRPTGDASLMALLQIASSRPGRLTALQALENLVFSSKAQGKRKG